MELTSKAGCLMKRVNSISYYAIAKAVIDKDAEVPCPTFGCLRNGWRAWQDRKHFEELGP